MSRRRERGAAAIFAVFGLIVLGGFLALGMNVGHMMSLRNQLQNRVDSAALAGTMELDGTNGNLTAAHKIAAELAERHLTDRLFVPIDPNVDNDPAGDIVHGIWDFDEPDRSLAFTPADATTPPTLVNAMLVRSGRETERGNPMDVVFSVFLGRDTANVRAEAVAVGGAPIEGCSLPIAFADCIVRQPDGTLNCGSSLVFSSDTVDNLGFINLVPEENLNEQSVIRQLSGGCISAQVGDVLQVGNGNFLNKHVAEAFLPYLSPSPTGEPVKVAAPIIHCDSCAEGNCKFNQGLEVVGFATFEIMAVDSSSNPKTITITFDCNEEIQDNVLGGTGEIFGTTAPYTRLVR